MTDDDYSHSELLYQVAFDKDDEVTKLRPVGVCHMTKKGRILSPRMWEKPDNWIHLTRGKARD